MLKCVLLDGGIPPKRTYKHAAAYDLFSPSYIVLDSGLAKIGLKIKIKIPEGHFGWIACRSSFASNHCSVEGGIIDEDYTGEIIVMLRNHGPHVFKIDKGRAIAQLIILKYETPEVQLVEELEDTERGEKGFGSSDKPAEKRRKVEPVYIVKNVDTGDLTAEDEAEALREMLDQAAQDEYETYKEDMENARLLEEATSQTDSDHGSYH